MISTNLAAFATLPCESRHARLTLTKQGISALQFTTETYHVLLRHEDRCMIGKQPGPSRRDFLRTGVRGGFTLGGLLGLGLDLRAAQAEVRQSRIAGAREVPSVCPYCAVGCGQLVHVRNGAIINIEGNP